MIPTPRQSADLGNLGDSPQSLLGGLNHLKGFLLNQPTLCNLYLYP
jgi:hypothetical protein